MTEESRDGEILIEVKGMKKWFPIKGGMLSAATRRNAGNRRRVGLRQDHAGQGLARPNTDY